MSVTTRVLVSLTFLVAATFAGVLVPIPAYACSCSGMSTSRALRDADTVFRGQVTGVTKHDRRWVDLRFRVDAVYKGTAYADQVVASAAEGASCGLSPEVGSTWIIFTTEGIEGEGDEAVSRLVTNLCSGNLPLTRAPDLLGQPRPPRPGASDREERSLRADRQLTRGLAAAGVGLVAVVIAAGLALALVWRRRPPAPGAPSSARPKG